MTELIVSIGFDLIAMSLTAGYVAKLLVEEFFPTPSSYESLALESSAQLGASVQKQSLLSQSVFRRIR
jgi:hypothetical protein